MTKYENDIELKVHFENAGNHLNRKERKMKKSKILSVLLAMVFSVILAANAAAADTPSGTVSITSKSIAIGIGVSWGHGVLKYKGKDYKFSLEGLSVVDVGISSLSAAGEVYHLENISDFAGNFTAFEAGATIAGGAAWQTMKNQNGVVMKIKSSTKGVSLTLAPKGVKVKVVE